MTFIASKIIHILCTILWGALLHPAIYVIHVQKTIHPRFTDRFTTSDIFYLVDEIFTSPGEYYAWVLSAFIPNLGESNVLALLISTLLFAPFVIWPFLKSERYPLLRRMLCAATIIFVTLCVFSSLYIFVW